MDFVSIPRDTIINVEWDNRKLNSVYWGSKNNGGNGIDALRSHVKKLTGFDVDCGLADGIIGETASIAPQNVMNAIGSGIREIGSATMQAGADAETAMAKVATIADTSA